MNRRGLFGLMGAGLVASCMPQAALADAPRPKIGSEPDKAWYVNRLREAILRGEEVCTRTEGPLYETCVATLKMNEDTSRMTRPHGYIYWRVPRPSADRILIADLLAGAAWRDPEFVPSRPQNLRRAAPRVLRA